MSKIKSMSDLREMALETLEKLARGDIDTITAMASAKLCEGVVHTVKAELEYSRMIQEDRPYIPFMDNSSKTIEGNHIPKYLNSPKVR